MDYKRKDVELYVRIRPTINFAHDVISVSADKTMLNVLTDHASVKKKISLQTNQVFLNSSQDEVYRSVAENVLPKVIAGLNVCFLCYGMIGSGKSYTLTGSHNLYETRGLIPRAICHLFTLLAKIAVDHTTTVRITSLEIHNNKVYDLLYPVGRTNCPPNLKVTSSDKGVFIPGLANPVASTEEDALCLLFLSETHKDLHKKKRGSHANSHFVFTIYVETRSLVDSDGRYVSGRMDFVLLAAICPKGPKDLLTQHEISVRKSIAYLEYVVVQYKYLNEGARKAAFRRCALTQILSNVLDSKCSVILFIHIRGEAEYIAGTAQCIMFGQRMARWSFLPELILKYDNQMLIKKLQTDIKTLRRELVAMDRANNNKITNYNELTDGELKHLHAHVVSFLNNQTQDLPVTSSHEIQAAFKMLRNIVHDFDRQYSLRSALSTKEMDFASLEVSELKKLKPKPSPAYINIITPRSEDRQGSLDGKGFGFGILPTTSSMAMSPVLESIWRRLIADEKYSPSDNLSDDVSVTLRVPPNTEEGSSLTTLQFLDAAELDESVFRPEGILQYRNALFDIFKQYKGKELHDIFMGNKALLLGKKLEMNRLVTEMETIKNNLEGIKKTTKELHNKSQEVLITDDLSELGDHKDDLAKLYKNYGDKVTDIKLDIEILHTTDYKLRSQIVKEFFEWYEKKVATMKYLSIFKNAELSKPVIPVGHQTHEQHNVIKVSGTKDPHESAFFSAQMRTKLWLTHRCLNPNPGKQNSHFRILKPFNELFQRELN